MGKSKAKGEEIGITIPYAALKKIADKVAKEFHVPLTNPEGFEKYVREKLEFQMTTLIPSLLGLEYRFGEWNLKPEVMEKIAPLKPKAEALALEFFSSIDTTITPKVKARIIKEAQKYYEERVQELLLEAIEEKAAEYVEAVILKFNVGKGEQE